MKHLFTSIFLIALFLGLLPSVAVGQTTASGNQRAVEIAGVVRDSLSREVLPFAVIRLVGSDSSTIADSRGRYRLGTHAGNHTIELRKIGYRMRRIDIDATEGKTSVDVTMFPLPMALDTIYAHGRAESPGNQIMRRAIERKNDVLSRINDYQYDAYVKLVVRDIEKDPDSASSVFLITETQTAAYWEQPDNYQEVIRARRQSSNIDAEDNLVSVGQIVNFNRNRIELGQYSVVSPTADDALDFYDYPILDSLEINNRKVFRLAIVPRSNNAPYFAGMIDVADSTYDVLEIDVGTNESMRFDLIENTRYRQKMVDHGNDHWMPYEIQFSFDVNIRVPLPGLPEHLHIRHVAMLENFKFDEGDIPGSVGEFALIVEPDADDIDSTGWTPLRRLPLAPVERDAYYRIDSIESRPRSFGGYALRGLGLAFLAANTHDFFHFNRVEGAYLGAGWTWRNISPNLSLRTKLGYSFAQEKVQYSVGPWFRLSDRHRLWIGAAYSNEVIRRPTLVSGSYNPTFFAVFGKSDPHQYFATRGLFASASIKIFDFTTFGLSYNDFRHSSLTTRSDFSVFDGSDPTPPNQPISDGTLRSVAASISYDSRPLIRVKGRDTRMGMLAFTTLTATAEYSTHNVLRSDFDYRRFSVRLYRRQRTLGLGLTRLSAVLGTSTGTLPVQRYFMVDYGTGQLFEAYGFNTLGERNFVGDRIAMVLLSHDFDRLLFRKTGLPLVRDIPFTLTVFGKAFWSDVDLEPGSVNPYPLLMAPSAYTEVGFGLGNLTPMIAPFNFGVFFSWQLSDYATDKFEFRFGIPTP